ncbi:hypothetical protein ACVBEQ_16925 [Nakamurella sp. GG22]
MNPQHQVLFEPPPASSASTVKSIRAGHRPDEHTYRGTHCESGPDDRHTTICHSDKHTRARPEGRTDAGQRVHKSIVGEMPARHLLRSFPRNAFNRFHRST